MDVAVPPAQPRHGRRLGPRRGRARPPPTSPAGNGGRPTRSTAPATARELADKEALDRLLSFVDRLQTQSRRLQRASTWEGASKALSVLMSDHIGVSTWRERAWADGPAWQRNAADHVERIVAGLAELDHDGVAVPFTTASMRQIVGTLLDAPVRRRGDAAGAVAIADIGGAVVHRRHPRVRRRAQRGRAAVVDRRRPPARPRPARCCGDASSRAHARSPPEPSAPGTRFCAVMRRVTATLGAYRPAPWRRDVPVPAPGRHAGRTPRSLMRLACSTDIH